MRLLLLPGMDGTGRLFARLQEALPADLKAHITGYSTNELLDYAALADRIELPNEPFAIVAESFSGPIGIRLAARNLGHLRALVLVASFVRCPVSVPRFLGVLARPSLMRLAASPSVLRATLLNRDTAEDLVHEVRSALRTIRADVLAFRLRQILAVDATQAFASSTLPTLYLRGLRDRIVPRRVADELSQLRPDLEHADLDAPHLVLQSQPKLAASIIADFVRRMA